MKKRKTTYETVFISKNVYVFPTSLAIIDVENTVYEFSIVFDKIKTRERFNTMLKLYG